MGNIKKGTFYMTLGTGVFIISSYGLRIFSARFLNLSEYGFVNILISVLSILAILMITGISTAISKQISSIGGLNNPKLIENIKEGFLFTNLLSIIVAIFLLVFKDIFLEGLLNGNTLLFTAIILHVFLFSLLGFWQGFFQGTLSFKEFAMINITRGIMRLIAPLFLLVFVFRSVEGIAAGIVIATATSLLLAIGLSKGIQYNNLLKIININKKRFINVSILASSVSISNACTFILMYSGPVIVKFLNVPKGSEYAGLIGAALTISNLPIILTTSFFVVLFPHLNKAYVSDKHNFERLIKKSLFLIVIVGIIVIIILSMFGPGILKYVYGGEFVIDRIYFVILAFVSTFYLLSFIFYQVLVIIGSNRRILILRTVPIAVLLTASFYPISIDPLLKVTGALLIASASGFLLSIFFYKSVV
jgi:O-antigen/teichoic acid export membrane protein